MLCFFCVIMDLSLLIKLVSVSPKPICLSPAIFLHLIGHWRWRPVEGSTGQVAVPKAMPACAWVDLSYMSHAHISGNITLLRVRIHTTLTVESLLQSGFICVCVYRNIQAVRKTWALVYFGSRSCALALVLPASVCVLVYSPASSDLFFPLRAAAQV